MNQTQEISRLKRELKQVRAESRKFYLALAKRINAGLECQLAAKDSQDAALAQTASALAAGFGRTADLILDRLIPLIESHRDLQRDYRELWSDHAVLMQFLFQRGIVPEDAFKTFATNARADLERRVMEYLGQASAQAGDQPVASKKATLRKPGKKVAKA